VDSIFLKKHPKVLEWFARISNLAKLIHVLIVMIVREDMNIWKFKEYGVPKRFLIQ